MAAVEVEIAAAEGGARHFQNGIGGVDDFGCWAIFYYNLFISSSVIERTCYRKRKRRV